jgi:NADH dehydrogenase
MEVSREKNNPKRVLILGGGFGGVRAALDLDRRLPKEYSITLIDRKGYHLPQLQLYETATMHMLRQRRADYQYVEDVAGIAFSDIFRATRVQFLQANIKDVFLSDRSVSIQFPGELPEGGVHTGLVHFEFLVVALGSETNYFGIAGLKDQSFGLKGLDDSLNIRNAIEELFARKEKGKSVNIVIGGGGFTGVELAGELPGYLKKLSKKYDLSYDDVRITIVEAGESILMGAAKWLIARAYARLRDLGVVVMLETPIESYSEGVVHIKNDGIVPADILIWTAGVRANSLLERILGAELTKTALVTDDTLALERYPHVYGIGDAIFSYDSKAKKPVPGTAQRAIDQGKLVAENIARVIEKKEGKKYEPEDPMYLVPIGGKYALGDLYGFRVEGSLAWYVRSLVFFGYLFSILPIYKAVSHTWRALVLYGRND